MRINAAKTKEMLINFNKAPRPISPITGDGEEIERVTSCTLLGIVLNDVLKWDNHIDKLYKKENQRLYFIRQLRRTKMSPTDIVKVFTTLVRPILEYACQLWHAGLDKHQVSLVESIQERALAMAYPNLTYDNAMATAGLTSLSSRRDELCKRLFTAAQDPNHKLFSLLPPVRDNVHNTRHSYKYYPPTSKTNRYKNTFINHCLQKQW